MNFGAKQTLIRIFEKLLISQEIMSTEYIESLESSNFAPFD